MGDEMSSTEVGGLMGSAGQLCRQGEMSTDSTQVVRGSQPRSLGRKRLFHPDGTPSFPGFG